MDDSEKAISELRTTVERQVAQQRAPAVSTPPLKEIAQRIKKLIHDDGEQFGNELEAKMKANGDKAVSMAKALQLWADDTLKETKSPA